MDFSRSEKITKIDAVRRQLSTAIRMFFADQDAVAIHTLAGAAHELLRGLLRLQGEGSLIADSDFIRHGRRQEWLRIVNSPRNFFKHSDRDPHEVIDWKPDLTVIWLLDCVSMYGKLTGEWLKEGKIFHRWFILQCPEYVNIAEMPEPLRANYESMRLEFPPEVVTKDLFLRLLDHTGL